MAELIEITPEIKEEYRRYREEQDQVICRVFGNDARKILSKTQIDLSHLHKPVPKTQEERERYNKSDALVTEKYEDFKSKYPEYILPNFGGLTEEQNFSLVFMYNNHNLIDTYLEEHVSEI